MNTWQAAFGRAHGTARQRSGQGASPSRVVLTVRSGVEWVMGLGHISAAGHATGGGASRILHRRPSRRTQSRLRSVQNTCGVRDWCVSHSTHPDPRKRKIKIKLRSRLVIGDTWCVCTLCCLWWGCTFSTPGGLVAQARGSTCCYCTGQNTRPHALLPPHKPHSVIYNKYIINVYIKRYKKEIRKRCKNHETHNIQIYKKIV